MKKAVSGNVAPQHKKRARKATTVRDSKTVASKRAFLQAYASSGNISIASEAANIDRGTHYKWLRTDARYVEAFEAAQDIAMDLLEEEARRRAVNGVRRLKFDRKGQAILDPETQEPYTELEYSDTLLIFLLKGGRPEKYRERVQYDFTAVDEQTLIAEGRRILGGDPTAGEAGASSPDQGPKRSRSRDTA